MLKGKSIHELRAIAQGYNVSDIFSKNDLELIQAIELKQHDMQPKAKLEIPKREYDARLMTKPPAKKSDQESMQDVLSEHIARGLHLTFPDQETWKMTFGKKEDNGTMRMALRTVVQCADKVMS